MNMPEIWDESIFMSQEDKEYFDKLLLTDDNEDEPLEEDYVLPAIPDYVAY